jgi:hypothetical protein
VQGDDGAKFENLVALSLLKHVHAKVDCNAQEYALHYLRTKDGHEVDFALVNNQAIETMIEVKLSDEVISKTLRKFKTQYQYTAIQLVKNLKKEYQEDGIQVLKAEKFLEQLFL